MAQSQSHIGIELGSSATKVVEIRRDATTPVLVTYGIAEHDHAPVKSDARRNTEEMIQSLKNVISLSRVTTDRAVVALPAMNVFHTLLEMPPMPEKDITSAIQWEAKRIVPMSLEKMTIDWHLLSAGDTEKNKKMKIILTAAPTDLIQQYIHIIQSTGLQMISLESEINALQRSLLPETTGVYLLVDIGATNTNMVLFDNRIPVQVRNINVGTEALNLQIASAMKIDPENTPTIRHEIGIPLDPSPHPAAKAILFVMETLIIKEIRRFVQPFRQGSSPIEHIILTGGGSLMKNCAAYFARELGIAAHVGDPWKGVSYHPDLSPQLATNGPQMAVAVGLALKK